MLLGSYNRNNSTEQGLKEEREFEESSFQNLKKYGVELGKISEICTRELKIQAILQGIFYLKRKDCAVEVNFVSKKI